MDIDCKVEFIIILIEGCVIIFPIQLTFLIFLKSKFWVSVIRMEGVLCDMFFWGTKNCCRFLSFVRISRVLRMNTLKNCICSIIYVERINSGKLIEMYRSGLCEEHHEFYWKLTRKFWNSLFFVCIAGFEKLRRGVPSLVWFLFFFYLICGKMPVKSKFGNSSSCSEIQCSIARWYGHFVFK